MRSLTVNSVAILGAGVMGAQIAALFANQGIKTYLYDLKGDDQNPNMLAKSALNALKKLKPPPFGASHVSELIQPVNYDQHLDLLSHCDLVIEAIAERLDYKQKLYDKVGPYLKSNVIFASNTSGLSIESLKSVLPKAVQANFCGIHFFNPPRYMRLVELIPHASSDMERMSQLEAFLVTRLGKGVVFAKDTPNFIGNRIGVFSLLTVLHYAEQFRLSPDLVDALTGLLIGRPKSATYRTMDVVGLDTLAHVVNTMKTQLKDDPWSARFVLPSWIHTLIEKGALGQKSKAGIFKKEGKDILVFDVNAQQYRKTHSDISQDIKACFKQNSWEERFAFLQTSQDKQCQFLWACFRDLFHYCAYHLQAIGTTARDIDLAMRWGYGWEKGPFEIWQMGNWHQVAKAIQETTLGNEKATPSLPSWALKATFQGVHYQGQSYNPNTDDYEPRPQNPVYQRQLFSDLLLTESSPTGDTLLETEGVRLWTLDKDIGIISFKSKRNCVGDEVLAGIQEAISFAETELKGLVIWQSQGNDFSVGANLLQVKEALDASRFDKLEQAVTNFQLAALRIQQANIPVVAAIKGLVLGGGCELAMHARARVAAFETYMGLVEVGVGLLPAGGGSKELARRAFELSAHCRLDQPLMLFFDQIIKAKISNSALEAKSLNYMRSDDVIVAHPDELLFTAIEVARHKATVNDRPPVSRPFAVLGKEGIANMLAILVNLREGQFITDYEYVIGQQVAEVLCGGPVETGTLVDEDWMLKLERDALLNLLRHEETQERITHMLKTGKPLRN